MLRAARCEDGGGGIVSASNKTRRKSAAKSKPRIEYAGNAVVTNYWVKIGFSREELGALAQIAGLFERKCFQTTGHAARLVLNTALMHWEKLEPLAFADDKYLVAEGFLHKEIFRAKVIAHKFKLKKTA